MKKSIEVCLSPDLIDGFELEGTIVVVVDILRATSCMVTGLAYGVDGIIPVATLEECKAYQQEGLICGAERGGQAVEGFELDNSPFSYMEEGLEGKTISMTTTNGTLAIIKSSSADDIIIGSFLNISAIADYLTKMDKNVVIHCAGWKGRVNMEDSLFAGALVDKLKETHEAACDAPVMVLEYFRKVQDKLFEHVKNSAHAKRLAKFGVLKDIEYCMTFDLYDVIPIMKGNTLKKM